MLTRAATRARWRDAMKRSAGSERMAIETVKPRARRASDSGER
jgi:hypothetical protein